MFDPNAIDFNILRNRAFNHRWATVPDDVIPLTAADPDFKVAPPITEAINNYVKAGHLNYGPPEGLPEFRESLASYFSRHRNLQTNPNEVLAVDSAAYGIYLTCKALLKKGNEAIIFNPVDFLFRYGIESASAKAISLPTPANQPFDIQRLEELVTDRTRLICLCNPLNPTGKVFKKTELEGLVDFAYRHNLTILSDEIWSDIVFKPAKFISIASLNKKARQNTITITGFSKSYGLAGLRIGAILTQNQDYFDQILKTSQHDSTVHGANTIGQVAAVAALSDAQPWLNGFLDYLHQSRDILINRLNAIPGFSCHKPEGCYLAFPDITKTGMAPEELQHYLLTKAKVSIVPGIPHWFGDGARGHMRISFATSHQILEKAMDRIEKAMRDRLF